MLVALLPFHLLLKRILPHPIGTGWKEGVIGLLLLGLIVQSLRQRRVSLPRTRLNLPVALFLSFLLFRFFASPFLESGVSDSGLWTSVDAWGLYMMAKYIPIYFITLSLVTSPRKLSSYLGVMLLVGVICSLGGVSEFLLDRHFLLSEDIRRYYGGYDLYIYDTEVRRVYFTFDFPGALASYLGMLIPLAVAFIATTGANLDWIPLRSKRAWLGGAGLVLATGLALTFSRGAWVALASALGFMGVVALLLDRNLKKVLYLLLVGVILALLFLAIGALASLRAPPSMGNVVLAQFASSADWGEHTNVGRVEAWRESINRFKNHPLWGQGLGMTGAVSLRFMPPEEGFVTESQLLKVAVETGVIGLLAYFLVWAMVFAAALRAYSASSEPFSRAFLWGAVGSLLGIFVHGLAYQVLEVKQTDLALWFLAGGVGLVEAQLNSARRAGEAPAVGPVD